MAPGRRLRLMGWAAGLASALAAQPAAAQDSGTASGAAARRHFESARSHYNQGDYKEAITELEAAHALDPTARDLVFNLGIAHDKLSHVDEALRWFRLYLTMDPTDKERDRAEGYVRRLETTRIEADAKRQDAAPVESRATVVPSSQGAAPPVGRAETVPHADAARTTARPDAAPAPDRSASPSWLLGGRVDAATIVAASVGAGALVFGTVMGIKAKADQPSQDFVTGRDGTYADLTSRTDTAYREALLADVGFATAVVSGALAAYLYFGRKPATRPAGRSAVVSLAARPGGAAVSLRGGF